MPSPKATGRPLRLYVLGLARVRRRRLANAIILSACPPAAEWRLPSVRRHSAAGTAARPPRISLRCLARSGSAALHRFRVPTRQANGPGKRDTWNVKRETVNVQCGTIIGI